MVRMKMRAANMHKSKMEQLFRCMDADGDKRIQKHEFQHVMKDNHIRTWLSSMDMDPGDADIMFDLLRGDDDLISVEELITGIGRLRGPARSIDMRRLLAKLEEQRGTDANTQFPHLGVAAV
ncbi:unnamed protein product [Prorocentrum cordatum]|uniref:EF-hand domain-containing protein n=1 Tax=Prorocentrum cordatum TaxID=2364126 RepID=A0ABN9WZE3_9DINO|nr:unnamed protein product [Polarella glacialis]